jgi:hypothetical protein
MVLNEKSELWPRARRTAMRICLGVMILWPPLHAVASKVLGFSSWRFFGWGMYATPHPESLSVLRIVWFSENSETVTDYRRLYEELRLHGRSGQKNGCFDAMVKENGAALRDLSVANPCDDGEVERHLAYFRHFGSKKHLALLVEKASPRVGAGGLRRAVVFLFRQRLQLESSRAFTEREIFEVSGRDVLQAYLE